MLEKINLQGQHVTRFSKPFIGSTTSRNFPMLNVLLVDTNVVHPNTLLLLNVPLNSLRQRQDLPSALSLLFPRSY